MDLVRDDAMPDPALPDGIVDTTVPIDPDQNIHASIDILMLICARAMAVYESSPCGWFRWTRGEVK